MLLDTLYQILRRDGRVRLCTAVPMGDFRWQVSEQAMRDYFATLFETVYGVPAHFVFNMDPMTRGKQFGMEEFFGALDETYHSLNLKLHLKKRRSSCRVGEVSLK
jgi:hypothetical protein